MFVNPGTAPDFGQKLTHDAAERVAGNWTTLLLNGLLLIVAGVLIFSIDWSVRSLSTFIGVLFIVQGFAYALTSGIDQRVRRANVVTGLLSIAAGVAIMVWPSPGIVVVAIFLGVWLIVIGTLSISGAFAARRLIPGWWLLLITGLLEVPLGVLALANPGATLAALITVGGIWAVAVGVTGIVLAFEVKHLPKAVDNVFAAPVENRATRAARPAA
ncbi:MAG TPA: DUF308 domain-containing protein [Thermoleophilaceae bacterium]|jgi:uncharacterized membrane protein HdeD (DUF308 family)|nr:DUF308 domain-containing protein [Thermoleophilaceae bacterium]